MSLKYFHKNIQYPINYSANTGPISIKSLPGPERSPSETQLYLTLSVGIYERTRQNLVPCKIPTHLTRFLYPTRT